MGSQLTTLTSSDIQRFERDGYVVVRQAFSRADGLAMERQWWREMEDTHGIRPDDRSSWRQIAGDLKAAKRDPIQARILTGRVRGVFGDLLGAANRDPFRVTPSADPAGRPDSREPAARFDRRAPGTVPPLSSLAHGSHGASAVTRRPDRRFHGRGNYRRGHTPSRGRIDGPTGGHGLLPSRHGPLRRSEPRLAAALHADQNAGSHPRRS